MGRTQRNPPSGRRFWAVLAGNTRTVSALFQGRRILQRIVVPTGGLRHGKGPSWALRLRRSSDVEGVIVASVVPPVDGVLSKSLSRAFGRKPEFITADRKWGIRARVPKPSQVGADRLANAAAARELYGSPSIVVDYGTGTTFDVVDRKGDYCGGAILPGLGISLRALHDFTAKIPLVPFGRVRKAIGRTTEEAVRSGVYHGAVGTSRELLLRIRAELGPGGKRAPAIATGGWSFVFKKSGLFRHVEPDLTLLGLAILWEKRHITAKARRPR